MLYLFFFGFIFIFGAGYIFVGGIAIWITATVVVILLNKIFGLFNFRKQKSEISISKQTANLADPIGAMSIVAQRYNDVLFLKDIAFLEVQLFGRNSNIGPFP